MERFKGLLKTKAAAVSVFEKAKKDLEQVMVRFGQEITDSHAAIDAYQSKISQHKAEQDFARQEISKASATIQKIDSLLT